MITRSLFSKRRDAIWFGSRPLRARVGLADATQLETYPELCKYGAPVKLLTAIPLNEVYRYVDRLLTVPAFPVC